MDSTRHKNNIKDRKQKLKTERGTAGNGNRTWGVGKEKGEGVLTGKKLHTRGWVQNEKY